LTIAEGIWQIEQGCPQCGAPVTLAETDRLLICPFCRTRLYLVPQQHFHYHIAPAEAEGELLYIPYWRLRGFSFCVSASEITHRFVDTNTLAIGFPGLPGSLGLRPQVLRLRFVSPATPGRFLAPALSVPSALTTPVDPQQGVFYRDYIGETLSVIHAPLYLRDRALVDAVLDRTLHNCTIEETERLLSAPEAPRHQVLFIPTLCPHCGWDMEGQKDSLVLICRNCNSGWTCPRHTFEPLSFAVLTPPAGAAEVAVYLPFWRMQARFTGVDLISHADLIRFANLPKRVTPAMESAPLYFWSPAFKVNPALYTRWARQMTVFQPAGDTRERLPDSPLYPVTLPLTEAADGITLTLALLVTDKRGFYPLLAGLGVTIDGAVLEYHPFIGGQNELRHAHLQVALNPTALAYGIRM
jgi:uncharacterized protein YbaR (Trm112 family)